MKCFLDRGHVNQCKGKKEILDEIFYELLLLGCNIHKQTSYIINKLIHRMNRKPRCGLIF